MIMMNRDEVLRPDERSCKTQRAAVGLEASKRKAVCLSPADVRLLSVRWEVKSWSRMVHTMLSARQKPFL